MRYMWGMMTHMGSSGICRQKNLLCIQILHSVPLLIFPLLKLTVKGYDMETIFHLWQRLGKHSQPPKRLPGFMDSLDNMRTD